MNASRWRLLGGLAAIASLWIIGCGGGQDPRINDAFTTEGDLAGSITSSVAGPIGPTQTFVESTPREVFGTSPTDLSVLSAFDLNAEERAHVMHGMQEFTHDFTPAEGLGPYFNGRTCMDCHQGFNTAVHRRNPDDAINNPPLVQTIVSRGQSGSGFTLFGDYSPATGMFNPLTEFGGPFLHLRTVNGAPPQVIPPESIDPNLRNAGMVRAVGIRAAPPYIGRGLVEAIPDSEIARFDDPFDSNGDGISGRHNENHENIAFVGGSPVVRLARFGVRAGGTTLLMFMLGGTCQQIGLTTPFCPRENNGQTQPGAYDPVPDPELSAQDVYDFRSFVRHITPPMIAPLTPAAQRGAQLFGVRQDPSDPTKLTPYDESGNWAFGMAAPANRNLNCVGCHIPFHRTGQSPAEIGARHLSNKIFPIFGDFLLHDMGNNLSDATLPAGTTGLATPREFRTAPLIGINFSGPPFFHDARVTIANQDQALIAAINLHDNYGQDTDSEGHNAADAFRRLSSADQQAVLAFLKSL